MGQDAGRGRSQKESEHIEGMRARVNRLLVDQGKMGVENLPYYDNQIFMHGWWPVGER